MDRTERRIAQLALGSTAIPVVIWLSLPRGADPLPYAVVRHDEVGRGAPVAQPTDALPARPTKATLADAFRQHQATRCDRYDSDLFALRCIDLTALSAGWPPAVETTWVLGLGMPAADVQVRVAPTAADFAEIGLAEAVFDAWIRAARRLGVSRIERWGVFIQDGYHGQPGLVVRQDVALRVADGWEVHLDDPSPLLRDHRPIPPTPMACTRTSRKRGVGEVWRCGAPKSP